MAVTLVNTFNLDDGGAAHEPKGASSVTAINFAGDPAGASAAPLGSSGGLDKPEL